MNKREFPCTYVRLIWKYALQRTYYTSLASLTENELGREKHSPDGWSLLYVVTVGDAPTGNCYSFNHVYWTREKTRPDWFIAWLDCIIEAIIKLFGKIRRYNFFQRKKKTKTKNNRTIIFFSFSTRNCSSKITLALNYPNTISMAASHRQLNFIISLGR